MIDPLQANERQEEPAQGWEEPAEAAATTHKAQARQPTQAQDHEETEMRGIDKVLYGMKKHKLSDPEGARRHVLGQGKPFIHLSKDRTEIVTEYPDGRIESQPLKDPVPPDRPLAARETT